MASKKRAGRRSGKAPAPKAPRSGSKAASRRKVGSPRRGDTPREVPPRPSEEERSFSPETNGTSRVRLLVRDPEWLFAYWDVSPAAVKEMGRSLGERTLAVSRLTLRISDPVSGGSSDVLLPPGARWWYVRADQTPRSYRAELGLTLPSGEFLRFAQSNTVVTPRVGPSPQRAWRRTGYGPGGAVPFEGAALQGLGTPPPGPWSASSIEGAAPHGGTSEVFRPGGGSDSHRR